MTILLKQNNMEKQMALRASMCSAKKTFQAGVLISDSSLSTTSVSLRKVIGSFQPYFSHLSNGDLYYLSTSHTKVQ